MHPRPRQVLPTSRPRGDFCGPHVAFGSCPPRGRISLGAARRLMAVAIFRIIIYFLLVAGLLCFAMYIGTGRQKWRFYATRIVKWTVVAGLGFFAVLLLERLAVIL